MIARLQVVAALAVAGFLSVGCGDSEGSSDESDADVADAGGGGSDVADDTQDVIDASDSSAESETGEDDSDADAVSDAPDADDTQDVPVEVDAGTTCESEGDCDAPYVCLDEICRLPMGDVDWAEQEFTITEPEELTDAFGFIKQFAEGVSFLMLDVLDSPVEASRPAFYGPGDITVENDETLYTFQFPQALGGIVFRPDTDPERPTHGNLWISDEFTYEFIARVVFGDGFVGVSFDAQRVRLQLDIQENYATASGVLEGFLTREEAEFRAFGTDAEFGAFAPLVCSNSAWETDDDIWNLSDVLDCNGAVLDGDVDGDGTNESYFVRMDVVFNAVEFQDPI